jgi:hypothetical protein
MYQRNFNSQKHHSFEKNHADDYQTPKWLFNFLKEKFNIKWDLACDSKNCLIDGSPLFDEGFNALDANWSRFPGTKFCFPPFSRPYFSQYLQKAHREWRNGESSIVLAPLKTVSVDYFQSVRAPKIHVIYPRVNFFYNGSETDAPDSICVLDYDCNVDSFVVPNLHFLDLKHIIPSGQQR